jgi:hypothetical protein
MAERFTLGVISITFFLGLTVLYGAYRTTSTDSDLNPTLSSADSDFNIVFRYGVGAKNELNTLKGTYTKDMVNKPPITTKLQLTQDELESIHLKALEIDLFDYPWTIHTMPKGDIIGMITPYSTYYVEVWNGTTKNAVVWNNKYDTENEKYYDLMELVHLIIEIILSHPEYQKLPEPTAGYA